jgi:hypothetical protein
MSMNRSNVSGTLKENIQTIQEKIQTSAFKSSHDREVQHLAAVLEVANVIATRPIMATQEAVSIYLNYKKRYHSGAQPSMKFSPNISTSSRYILMVKLIS